MRKPAFLRMRIHAADQRLCLRYIGYARVQRRMILVDNFFEFLILFFALLLLFVT